MPYGNIVADIQTDSFGSVLSPSSAVFRNRIINGNMAIDQRNAGASVTPTSAGTYFMDRWQQYFSQPSKVSLQQNAGSVTPPAGFSYYLGATSLSAYSVGASDTFLIQQNIEGLNMADLNWGTANAKTVTLSFWVYSSLTGTFGGCLVNYSAQNYNYPFTYTVSSANTWQQISITISGPTSGTWNSTNTGYVTVTFSLGCGSSFSGTAGAWTTSNVRTATGATSVVGTSGATWYVTGVQIEKGTNATSFEYRPYGTELMLCQRYYETITGLVQYAWQSNASSTFRNIFMNFIVTKRTSSPSTALLSAVGGLTISGQNQFGFYAGVNIGNTTSDAYIQGYTCSAEL